MKLTQTLTKNLIKLIVEVIKQCKVTKKIMIYFKKITSKYIEDKRKENIKN